MSLPPRLLEGYHSFRTGRYAAEKDRYAKLGSGSQNPKIMMIACCDSRAAPETVFDAGPGELFVVRNVANLVPPYTPDGGHHATSAALEFALLALEVEDIVVMGHGRCGGIKAALSDASPLSHTDFIGSWVRSVKDVARFVPPDAAHGDHACNVEHVSIEHSLANLRTFPWVRLRENQKKLKLHGVWFDIRTGELHHFDEMEAGWHMVGEEVRS